MVRLKPNINPDFIKIIEDFFDETRSYKKVSLFFNIPIPLAKEILKNREEAPVSFRKKPKEKYVPIRKVHKEKLVKPEKEKRAISLGNYDLRLRRAVVDKLGGKCIYCGFSDIRALQIDHIDGGGTKERKSIPYRSFLLSILRGINKSRVQLLCANCNWIKRFENKECNKL